MASRTRSYPRCGGRSGAAYEQHGRALMQLILEDVILRKSDRRNRRMLIAFSSAALSVLLSRARESSEIYLSDVDRLAEAQLERVLSAVRYVHAARHAVKKATLAKVEVISADLGGPSRAI